MTSPVQVKTKENLTKLSLAPLNSDGLNTRPRDKSGGRNDQGNHVTEGTNKNSVTLDRQISVLAHEAMNKTTGNHGHQQGSSSVPSPHRHRSNSSRGEAGEKRVGLCNVRAMLFLILWYLFSAFTLFLNKYILSTLKGDPQLLGTMQMVMTTLCGLFQMYFPLGMYTPVHRERNPPNFWRNMILVGTMRFLTVILGLEALKYVAVSFTETVKSSAPIFTVLISRVIMNEHTGMCTALSLLPIMGGLALCSAYELSYNLAGLMAALATNLTECFQNVYSKLLISGERHSYTPAELQFYTSLSSIVILLPVVSFLIDIPKVQATFDLTMLVVLVLNGMFFHFQSITAYVLMDYISPVTHSVANTVKRAFLIWTSVIIFGNPVTLLSGLGTVTVTIGVLMYTKAKEYDHNMEELRSQYACTMQPDGTRVI